MLQERLVSLKTFPNQRKTYRFPGKFAREAPTKSAILYQSFFSETGLENSCEIGHFFRKFVPENPAKFDFFSVTYQKPCCMEGGGKVRQVKLYSHLVCAHES